MKRPARAAMSAFCLTGILASCARVPDTETEHRRQAAWTRYTESEEVVKAFEGLDAPGQAAIRGRYGLRPDDAEAQFLVRHLAVEEAISDAPLVAGNDVTLLNDGPRTYRAMLRDIAQARHFVHMESYIFEDDEAGQAFADAFIAKRREGIPVALMVDGVGSKGANGDLFERMRDAGVQVAVFNPVNPAKARGGWKLNNRNHRKLLIVDGRVGFVGGINISSVYSSSPSGSGSSGSSSGGGAKNAGKADGQADDAPWRDTHVRIAGPAVAQMERIMQEGWTAQRAQPLPVADYFPKVAAQGNTVVRMVANRPGDADGYTLYLTLMSAISSAQRSIYITMAYFVPDPAFIKALIDAAGRGVDVKLVLPGFSDSSLVFHAGRSHYDALLHGGVQIAERRDAFLHAKTILVDGVWSSVGSSNLDWRSFALNHELNAVILSSDFGALMQKQFDEDLAAATPVDAETWARRGVRNRMMESFSRLFERWL